MARLDSPHVPVVDRGELGDAEPFGGGDNRSIRDTERKPFVSPDKLDDPHPVLLDRMLDLHLACHDGVEKSRFRVRADLGLGEVADLGDDQAGYATQVAWSSSRSLSAASSGPVSQTIAFTSPGARTHPRAGSLPRARRGQTGRCPQR